MIRIAFDLRGPAFVATDENRRGSAEERCGSREEECFSGHVFFGLLDVRNNLFRGLKDATTEARERE